MCKVGSSTLRVSFLTKPPSLNVSHQCVVVTLATVVNTLPIVFLILSCTKLQHLDDFQHNTFGHQTPTGLVPIKL